MRAVELIKTGGVAGRHARAVGVLAVTLTVLLALAMGVAVEGYRQNSRQLILEQAALADALAVRLQEQALDLSHIAREPKAALAINSRFDRLLWLSKSDAAGAPKDFAAAQYVATILRGGAWDKTTHADVTGAIADSGAKGRGEDAQGFVAMEGEAFAGALAPVKTSDARALIGLRRLNEEYLQRIESLAHVTGLHIATGYELASNQASMQLSLADSARGRVGEAAVTLAWEPKRPGDTLILGYGLWLLSLTIVVAALLVWQAHLAVRHLKASEAQARRLAGFDPLTGLPNRFVFAQFVDAEFARSSRGGGPFAYIAVDIDRFRVINDGSGQEAGDQVIVGVAERIKSALRAGDRLGRIDGDKFAILQTEIVGPRECADLAARIFEVLKEPIRVGALEVEARLSIGVALHPADAPTREDLMLCADQALQRAKAEGRNRYAFFEKKLGDDIRARKMTEMELRAAIHNGGLRVMYQPIMTVDGSRMSCVEALVRWSHPQRGLIPPDQFIALAEDRGLILELGEFVLRQACRDGRAWPGLRVAVNVSPLQFKQQDFAQIVEQVLSEEGFSAAQLELELTEGVVIADADQAENVMMDLRALGVRLALDDFGTGYSSLVYLRRFAFDKIKIDRSFLEAMETTGESAIIIHSIIHLGRALGLTVTAEGIETPEQQRFLQAAGAHELQGYLFSRPVSAEEITRMIAPEPLRASA